MPRAQRIEFEGAIYHVTTRGDNKEDLFLDDYDRNEYVRLLAQTKEKQGIKLLGYCLMNNHTHLVLQTGSIGLSKVMHRLNNLYAHYFNQRYGRVGHLFQERYFAKLCIDDKYLLAMLTYIDFNPVQARLVVDPIDYRWSSHREYASLRADKLVDSDFVFAMFHGENKTPAQVYRQFVLGVGAEKTNMSVEDWVTTNDDHFVGRQVETAVELVGQRYGLTKDDLAGNKKGGQISEARAALAFLLVEEAHLPILRVAQKLGKMPSTLHTALAKHRWDEGVMADLVRQWREFHCVFEKK